MKNKTLETIGKILLVTGIFFSLLIPFIGALTEETTTKEVPCYDKHNNMIKDAICYEEKTENLNIYLYSALLFLLISVIGAILILYTINNREEKTWY